MSTRRNLIRIERTRDDLDRLHSQVDKWLELRRDGDKKRRQYSTQLDNLGTFFDRLFAALGCEVACMEAGVGSSQVYEECRTVDLKLVWLRGVWEYYAEKFDQRDDGGRLGSVIKAADEVVWSCYAGFYKNVSGSDRKAAPLPYIEPLYTPLAIPRDEPPPALRSNFISGEFFQTYLKEMPIPVIGLPHGCLDAPWWMIYIGHEVGHHVQHDLLPDYGLVGPFGTCLRNAAKASDAAKSLDAEGSLDSSWLAEQWKGWGQEVFADAFSIYCMGKWALWATTELLLGDAPFMLTEVKKYPAPAVRLKLMAELATTLNKDGGEGLRDFDPVVLTTPDASDDETAARKRKIAGAHLTLVPALAEAIDGYAFEGMGAFRKLSGWEASDFESSGSVKVWTDRLRGRQGLIIDKHIVNPRFVASAGIASWAEVEALPDAQRADAETQLVERFLKAATDSGPEGKRAAGKPAEPKSMETVGDRFARRFLEASAGDLGL